MREIRFKVWDEFPKYQVGDDGSVYSLDYNHTGKRKEIKQRLDDDGYPYVVMVVSKKRYKRIVHRMVAKMFVENPENKPQVNHKNGIRNCNDYTNLEWVTSRENTIHGFRVNGRQPSERLRNASKKRFSGANNPKAKIGEAEVLSIRRLRSKGVPLRDIADRIGISVAQVSAIANNKFWKDIYTNPELLKP